MEFIICKGSLIWNDMYEDAPELDAENMNLSSISSKFGCSGPMLPSNNRLSWPLIEHNKGVELHEGVPALRVTDPRNGEGDS